MKYGVNRQVLLITAGIVWIVAGANILRIGIVTWLNDSQYWLFRVGEATVVFLLFLSLSSESSTTNTLAGLSKRKREKLPLFFLRCKGMDRHVFHDSNGNHHPDITPVARHFHFGILHRTLTGTYVHRHIIYTLLVAQKTTYLVPMQELSPLVFHRGRPQNSRESRRE